MIKLFYNMNNIIILFSLFIIFSCAKKDDIKKNRPNILFIMSDDHAYQAISAYSERLLHTPNIDKIAEQGAIFDNACVTNSICAPSRATILTGKHNHINGKIDNRSPFDTSQVTFPQLFQQAGYQTAMFGKLHFGNNPKGVDDFMILPGQGHYVNPDFITKNGDTTIIGYVTDIITDLTLDWLKNKRDPHKPFLMMYLHKAPHRPWWPSPEKFQEYTKKEFPLPKTLFDDYKNRGIAAKSAEMNLLKDLRYGHDSKIRPAVLKSMSEVEPFVEPYNWGGSDGFTTSYIRFNEDQKALYDPVIDSINVWFKDNWSSLTDKEKMEWKYQRYMQDYLGCIASVDENMGRVLNYLEENGLDENTIVIYTSDQGFYLGEHGWFDKRWMYEESFKMPFVIKNPRTIKAGTTSDAMVMNVDFAPTLLDMAGLEIPSEMQGKSFKGAFEGGLKNQRKSVYYHYYEWPIWHKVQPHYGVRTDRYKLMHFYYSMDEWELYDLKTDPNEMHNIYSEASPELIEMLKKELQELRKEYKDDGSVEQMKRMTDTVIRRVYNEPKVYKESTNTKK